MKNREYQIAYRELRPLTIADAAAAQKPVSFSEQGTPTGPVLIATLRADHEEEVREMFAGFHIVKIFALRIVLDPAQHVFTREEAAEFLRVSETTIDSMMKANRLPKATKGFPRFTRPQLEKVLSDSMKYDDNKKNR